MLVSLESCFGFCTDESLINELDLQMKHYQDYRNIITSHKRTQKHEIFYFSPDVGE